MVGGGAESRLRVALVVPHLEVGGLQRATLTIARNRPDEVDLAVVTVHDLPGDRPADFLAGATAAATEVVSLGVQGRVDRSPRALLTAVRRMRRFVRHWRPDVLDSAILEADLVARAARPWSGCRLVTHLVSTTYAPNAELAERAHARWRPRAVRVVDRQTARLSDSFVAISEAVRSSAVHDLGLPAERVVTIPRGVDLDTFSPGPRPVRGAELGLVAVGRLSRAKNFDNLLRAVALLGARGTRVRLTVAGQGPDRERLQALAAELELQDRVRLLPPVEDVAELLGEHDVFVMPSRWEGLGNSLVEALACGLPVVVSDIPTFREVVPDPVAWVDPLSPDSIADGLAQAASLSPAELTERGRRSRDRAVAAYDARALTARLVDHWVVLGRRRGSR